MSPFKSRFSPSSNYPIDRAKRKSRKITFALARSIMMERLERRLLLSTINWIGSTGDWSNANNWSPAQVPSGSDNVTIPASGNVTISSNQAVGTIMTAAGSSLTIGVGAQLSISGTGGTISGSFDWAGVLTGNGADSLTLAGTTTFTGSTDAYPVINSGTFTSNDGELFASTFTNNGTLTITNGIVLAGNGTFTNSSTGTVSITDSTGFNPSNPANGIGGTFVNQGTLNWAAGGATNVPGGLELENIGGTLNITSGNVTVVGGAAFQNGQIEVATGSALTFDNGEPGAGTSIILAGTITGSGGGTIDLNSGSFYAQALGQVASNATLNFPQGMAQVGNVIFGDAGNTLINDGYLDFDGSAYGNVIMTNNGTIISSGSADLKFQTVVNGATGVVDFQTDAGIANSSFNSIGLTNMGTDEKTGGTGTSILADTYFNDGGSLNVQTGTISFQNGSTGFIAGPITIATGAVLNFDGTNGIYIQGTLSSSGGGTVTVTRGWLDGPNSDLGESDSAASSLNFAPNTLFFEGGDIENGQDTNLINTGTAYFQGGGPMSTMENTGTINVDGSQYAVPKGAFITTDACGTMVFTGATSIVTGVDAHIVNAGLIQFNPGASGTIDLATPFPLDTFRFTPGIANTGTFEVMSGTLKFPTISFGADAGDIDTGTFRVDAGASLISDTTDPITTNNGNVILLGNAFFPDIASLATNNGGFTVGTGATFSTAGSLTNAGTLTVGGNLTVNGDLTESGSTSTLTFAIGGVPGSAGAPVLTVTGNTTLAGNLTATLANGFAGSTGTSYTVATFANATTSSFDNASGVAPDFTAAVNPTSIVLDSTGGVASNAVDLDVTSVTGPTGGSPGSAANISWNVTNEGTGTTSGTWRDSAYLTTNGLIDSNSILLGRVTESTPVGAGGSYTGTLDTTLPSLPVANYKIVVLVDSGETLPDTNRANNGGVSTAFTTTIPTLTLNSANNGTIAPGQQLLYRLIVPAGADVSLAFTFPTIDVAVGYASFNVIPTASSHDEFFADFATGSMFLPVHQGGSYYILLQGSNDITSPQSFTLTPTQVTGLNVQAVSPTVVPDQPNTAFTLTITGSGFNATTTASLVLESTTLNAQSVTLLDSNTIAATFQLPPQDSTDENPRGALHDGAYDIDVTNSNDGATLPEALNLFNNTTSAGSGQLNYTLRFPSGSRGDLNNTVYLEYSNTSQYDIPAPYFIIFGDDTSFKLADQTSFSDDAIEVFGGATTGLPGVLLPGEGGVIPITYTQTTIFGHQLAKLEVAWVDALPAFDTSSLLSALQPVNEPNDAWAAISANFAAIAKANPQSLTGVLRDAANALSLTGVYTSDPAVLTNYAIQEAGDFGAIDQRYNLGAFGRGQSDPYAVAAASDSTGNVTITSGGEERFFIKQTNGTYQGVDGDAATLALADGIYTLTETSGQISVFNIDGTLNYTRDTNGNGDTYGYTGGNLTSIVANDGDTYIFTYDANGRITQVTDPAGRHTTYTYDSTDQLLLSITNAQGTTSFTYYSGSDLADMYAVTSITYPDGSTRDYTYDVMGRLTSQQWSDGSNKFTYTYDNLGHQATTDALGNTAMLMLSRPGQGTTSIIDALGNVARVAYTSNGQVTSETSATNDATTNAYNSAGDITSVTDPLGDTTSFTYDSTLNRLLTLTDPDGNQATFAYDADGNLTTVTDAAGDTSTNTFNSSGELTNATSPAGRTVAITYTSFGGVASRTYVDGSTVTYTYDSHRNLISAADSLNGTITYTYDSADRLTHVTEPGGLSLSYAYNANGQLASETDQTGFVTNYTYNSAGQITQITNSSGLPLTTYTYDADGNLIKTINANGTSTTYTYNADNYVASITNRSAAGTIDSEFLYTYDANGNRLTQSTGSGTTDYTYDADNQLVKVVMPGGRTIQYVYDANGNRATVSDTALSSVTYSVNNLNEYVTVGSTTYGYDADGNLISSTTGGVTTTYTYNDRDQLASATVGGVLYTYGYDALGNLTSSTSNGVTTNYLIDPTGIGNVAAAFSSNGTPLDHYVYGNGLAGAVDPAGNDTFYDFDASGNTADITNAAGVVSNTYTYLPFGELLSSTGGSNLFTFGGQYGVQNTGDGLYTMRARPYDPSIGRFSQRDPLGIGGGDVNLYRYAGNDPVDKVDPTGTTVLAAAADGLVFLAQNGYLPLTAAQNLSAGLLGNVVRSAAADAASGFVSTLAANTGTIFTASGGLAADSVLAVSALPASASAPLVVPEGAAVWTGTTTSVTWSGAVNYGIGVTGSTLGVAALGLASPIIVTAANNYLHNGYQEDFPVDVQDVINQPAFHQTVNKPLIAQLISDFIRLNGHAPDQQQLNTLISYANSVEGGNAAQFIQTHSTLLGLTEYFNANDPNDLIGPSGFGAAGFIQDTGTFPYEITFENEPTASAPAEIVTIRQQLDSNLDWTTFQLGTIVFGSHTVSVPAGLTSYDTTVPVSSTLSVNIIANFDMATGLLTYTFTSIDPNTGDIPSGALDGFLPPDDSAGDGFGDVTYTVSPKSGLATGTAIHAQATIVFDNNAPIATPNILNTTDSVAPTSTVVALPATQSSANIQLTWSGSDDANGSGIANYQIFVSVDGGGFTLWQTSSATAGIFPGSFGHSYAFYSVATDNAGNVQQIPTTAQAATTVPAIARTIHFGGKTKATYTDSQGHVVTITLSGPGSGTIDFLSNGNADPADIIITGTTAKSSLTVKNSGSTTLSNIQINGSLASFAAPKANFSGTFDITGTLGSMTLNSVSGGSSTIHVEGSAVATTFVFGVVHAQTLNSAGAINSLTATQGTSGPFDTDSLSASAILKMQIKGDFDPTVSLTSSGAALGAATIKGAIAGGNWSVAGSATAISANSIAAGWNASFLGNVGTLAVKGEMDGSLSARSLKSLSVGGGMTNSNFTLTGVSPSSLLGSLAVKGAVSGGSWNISGGAKTISVNSLGGGLTVTLTGDVGTLAVKGAHGRILCRAFRQNPDRRRKYDRIDPEPHRQ